MASRKDYAPQSRRQRKAPAKSAPKPPKAPQPAPKKVPWKLAITTFLVLAGLVFLLNQLLKVDSTPAQPAQVERSVPAPKPEPKAKPAPKPSQPKPVAATPKTEKTVVAQPKVVERSTKAAPTPPPAPPKPKEEKFTFYELLPESEVTPAQVDAYKSTPRTEKLSKTYLLQAGSFRSAADAEKMRAQLLLSGLPNVKTSRSDGKNGVWYRVRLGPFESRSALNKAQDKLARLNISAMKIQLD